MDLDGDPGAAPPFPPHVTKTEGSRRTLALPRLAVAALCGLAEAQARERVMAGNDGRTPG